MSYLHLVAVGLLVAVALPWFVLSAWRRLTLFVGGTLVTAGSSAGVTGPEVLFVAVLAAIGIASLDRIGKARKKALLPPEAVSIIRAAKVVALATLAAAVTGSLQGASDIDVLRAAIPYVTLVIGLLVGLDFGISKEPGRLRPLTYVAGLASSLSFMLFYVSARGIADAAAIPILPSILLAGLVVALAVSDLLTHNRRLVGPAIAISLAIAAPVLSGGRSALALLAGFLVLFRRFESGGVRKVRMLVAGAISALVAVPIVTLTSAAFGTQQWLLERFSGISALWGEGLSADLSAEARLLRYGVAWQQFEDHPIVGIGFGAQYFDGANYLRYLDTPLMHLAVFGALGFAGLVYAVVSLLRSCYRRAEQIGSASGSVFVIATALIWLALAPLSAPMEDRGFSVAASLLIATTFKARQLGSDWTRPTAIDSQSSAVRDGRRISS